MTVELRGLPNMTPSDRAKLLALSEVLARVRVPRVGPAAEECAECVHDVIECASVRIRELVDLYLPENADVASAHRAV